MKTFLPNWYLKFTYTSLTWIETVTKRRKTKISSRPVSLKIGQNRKEKITKNCYCQIQTLLEKHAVQMKIAVTASTSIREVLGWHQ
jgi:hypothetical protein